MSKTIRICGIQSQYLDFLRQHDELVSEDPTQNRKFVGVLLEVNGHSYCAPLSSPKKKHQQFSDKAPDLFKIDGGVLGVINLNNMIPVVPSAIVSIDISQEPDLKYRGLLKKQMIHIRANEEAIMNKAKKLYSIVNSGKQLKLNERCCNYVLLEQMSLQYGATSATASQEVATTVQVVEDEQEKH